MNIANFLYRQTGRNIYKPVAPGVVVSVVGSETSTPLLNIDQSKLDLTIHTGPRGGQYRLNAKGRKVYLRTA